MKILTLQRKSTEIGRIRIGTSVLTDKGHKRPVRLDTFRFTTASQAAAYAVADVFGGTVRPWQNGRKAEWEVITTVDAIGVTVPPRDKNVNQAFEMWTTGVRERRCDGITVTLAEGQQPCLCPHTLDEDGERVPDHVERTRLAAKGQACKPVTRLNVSIPRLPGWGVWRLDTGGYYAAVEMADVAEMMEAARDRGGIALPAILRIDQRERTIPKPGKDENGRPNSELRKFPVPVLELLVSYEQIVTGQLKGLDAAALLPPAPGEPARAISAPPAQRAITAGTATDSAPDSAGATGGRVAAPPPTARPADGAAGRAAAPVQRYGTPQEVADAAREATDLGQLKILIDVTKERLWNDSNVATAFDSTGAPLPDSYSDLEPYLRRRWAQLPAPRPATEPLAGPPQDEDWPPPAEPPGDERW